MIQPTKLLLFPIIFLTSLIGYTQDQCKVVGWATQNGGVTGGGSATPTVVTTYAALKTALTTTSVKVVHVSGTITFPANGRITIQDTDGKTIIGLPGSRMISVDKTKDGSGILYIKRSKNFIMRNLTFEGPGAYDADGNDNLTIDNCTNFWVDHCDFQDGMDGNFDIKTASDYITATWCKFSYVKAPIPNGPGGANDHRYTNLIGSSDGATGDEGKLRVTFQYCWWGQGCVERMPRVRFGKIHLVNNLYNSTVSNNVIRAGYKADLLIESNVFIGVKKPIDLFENDFTAVTARDNIFTNTSGNTAGSGTAFTPPYTLNISNANTIQSIVTNTSCGAGATLDSPTQCGCGNMNQNPTATLTAPSTGSNTCVGTAITITATATDDGTVSKVDFYNGTTLLGTDNSSPYSYSYTPTVAGTLTLKATATDNAGLTGSSSTVSVTVNALPTAAITATATSFCTGGSVVLNASPGASYKWFRGTTQVGTAATYTANETGAYTVEVTNANGCKAISSVTQIGSSTATTPTISSSTTNLCTTGSIVLTASTGASYKWFKDNNQVATTATYTAVEAGAYTVEVTNASGCKAISAPRTLTGTPQATPTISSSTTNLCTTGSIVLTASTGASYKWLKDNNQVATTATYTAVEAGAYTVEVTNASGCKAISAPRTLSGTPQATPTISSSTTNLCTTGSIVLSASTGASYKWFKDNNQVATTATYTAVEAGAYTVEVTNASGCKAISAPRTLTGTPQATPTISSSTTNLCSTGSIVLTASTGASYKWLKDNNQVATTETYTAVEAGAYTVEVTNASGCKAISAARTLTGTPQATPTISSSTTNLCTTGSIVLTASTGASYKWLKDNNQVATTATYTAVEAGAYTVEVTNASGCKAISALRTLTGTPQATPTISSSTTNLCSTGSIVLTASTGASYKWFKDNNQVATTETYTAVEAGAYTVEVTNASGCKAISAARTLTGTPQATPTISSSTTSFCTGGSVLLTSSSGTSYKWFRGTTQVGTAPTYSATEAGTYTVEVTNASDCKAISAVTQIGTSTASTPTITASATSFCAGGSVMLTASTGTSYKWFRGTNQVGTTATYTANEAGAYTVEVTNTNGCKAISSSVQIAVTATVTWYADTDNDGIGDASSSLTACEKPTGYVSTSGDECPADVNKTTPGNCGCNHTETPSCITTATLNGVNTAIKVIPQPFDVTTSVSLENYGTIQSITIVSSSGVIIETKQGLNTESVSLGESLASGLYTVIVQSEKGMYTTKIVKK
jgi:pectate lyase